MSWKRPNVIDRMAPLVRKLRDSSGYWLDVGTGGGVFTELIDERFSTAMTIQMDKRRYSIRSQLHFLADLRRLPIRDNSIDTMICAQVLHYIPSDQLKAVLEDFVNRLSESGCIVIIEYVKGKSYPWVPYHISEKLLQELAENSLIMELMHIVHDNDRRRPKYAGYLRKMKKSQ